MKMENYVHTFADINCRRKVVNKENGEETFFNNLEEVDLFLKHSKLFEIVLLRWLNY